MALVVGGGLTFKPEGLETSLVWRAIPVVRQTNRCIGSGLRSDAQGSLYAAPGLQGDGVGFIEGVEFAHGEALLGNDKKAPELRRESKTELAGIVRPNSCSWRFGFFDPKVMLVRHMRHVDRLA